MRWSRILPILRMERGQHIPCTVQLNAQRRNDRDQGQGPPRQRHVDNNTPRHTTPHHTPHHTTPHHTNQRRAAHDMTTKKTQRHTRTPTCICPRTCKFLTCICIETCVCMCICLCMCICMCTCTCRSSNFSRKKRSLEHVPSMHSTMVDVPFLLKKDMTNHARENCITLKKQKNKTATVQLLKKNPFWRQKL